MWYNLRMAKPPVRCNTLCSSLTTIGTTRRCCDCLQADYDLTPAIRMASEIFFRLTGRQTHLAGRCLHVVRPCKPEECGCACDSCDTCDCDLDYVFLPSACEIERVTVNGLVVDPRTYQLSGSKLEKLCGEKWPVCQNLGVDSSPRNQFISRVDAQTFNEVTISRSGDGSFIFTTSEPLVLTGFDVDEVLEFVGEDGWAWLFPVASLTKVNDNVFKWVPSTSHASSVFDDVLTASDGWTVEQFQLKPLAPLNTIFSLENVKLNVRSFVTRSVVGCDNPCRTFEIVYRTGCCIPPDIQDAVGRLACELALASCGSDKCRLPSKYRSFKLDGDAVTSVDMYQFLTHGLTGLEEVDQVILSLNPNRLARRARVLGLPVGRVLRRSR